MFSNSILFAKLVAQLEFASELNNALLRDTVKEISAFYSEKTNVEEFDLTQPVRKVEELGKIVGNREVVDLSWTTNVVISTNFCQKVET